MLTDRHGSVDRTGAGPDPDEPELTDERCAMSAVVMTVQRPEWGSRSVGAGGLELTRRGRLAAFAAFLVFALALLLVVGGQASGSGERGEVAPVQIVHVETGDTLWDIATRVAPGADPREVIVEIERLNTLPAGSLPVGAEIAVPVR